MDDLLKQRMDGVSQQMSQLQERARQAAAPGTIDVDQLVEAQRYELSLRAQQRQLNQQRQAVAAEVERRREALVDANREVRVLEKLRERQARRYRREENRREIKQLDEVAGQRAARKERP